MAAKKISRLQDLKKKTEYQEFGELVANLLHTQGINLLVENARPPKIDLGITFTQTGKPVLTGVQLR